MPDMLQAATSETTAPCPKCRQDMVLAVVIPHPIAVQLARHTYLCGNCNQTKTYILPVGEPAGGQRTVVRTVIRIARQCLAASPMTAAGSRDKRSAMPATIYEKDGSFLLPCTIRDLSKSGGRLELFKEAVLPQYFLLSMLPDGGGRRLCSKVWQVALIVGVRFVEKQPG